MHVRPTSLACMQVWQEDVVEPAVSVPFIMAWVNTHALLTGLHFAHGRPLVVDCTHGTNKYGYVLLTILAATPHNLGAGFPLPCISSLRVLHT